MLRVLAYRLLRKYRSRGPPRDSRTAGQFAGCQPGIVVILRPDGVPAGNRAKSASARSAWKHGNVASLFFAAKPKIKTHGVTMIRKLKTGEYRVYSRKLDKNTGRRRNLGTFSSREAAQKHEREIQYFKRHG
jgi:hypothetical protein